MSVDVLYNAKRYNNDKRNPILSLISLLTIRLFTVVYRRLKVILIAVLVIFAIYKAYKWKTEQKDEPIIIIVTPTYKRPERLAEMTRLSQTLMHIKNIRWIVVEDGYHIVDAVERILRRSGIPYVYFHKRTEPGFPGLFYFSLSYWRIN